MTIFVTTPMQSQKHSERARWLGLVFAALIAITYATILVQKPQYNWDLIPYVAIALSHSGEPAATLREKTYETIERSVAPEALDVLRGDTGFKNSEYNRGADYRHMVAHDSKIFADQLPLYTVKPAYPAIISLVSRAGVDLVTASLAVSAVGYVAICILLYVWISRWLSPAMSLLVTAILSLTPFLTQLPRLATPDSLSVFTLMLGTFLVTETRFLKAGSVVFICSLFFRPENVIYVLIFMAYLLATRRMSLVSFLITLCAAFGIYFAETRLTHNYGWTILFYFTYFDWRVLEDASINSLKLSDYAYVYAEEIFKLFSSRNAVFPLITLSAMGAFMLKFDLPRLLRDRYFHLVLLAAVSMAARTAAMPGEPERSLLFSLMLSTVALVYACVLPIKIAK